MPDTESDSIELLVRDAAAGNREAAQALLGRYWPLIEHVVRARRRRMGPALADDTSDLAQEAAIEILASLPGQRWQGRQAFAAWIKKLAEYRVIDANRYHRRQKRDRAKETSDDRVDFSPKRTASPESRIDDSRRSDEIMQAISGLKEEYAAAVLMHHAGYSHAEIGTALGCSAEAARKLVSRGMAKLTLSQGK